MNTVESGARRLAWAVAAAVPWLVVVALTLRYGVDVPLVDQWHWPPLLAKSLAGTLTFEDVFAQYAEHRLFFPRLLTIGLARLSGWNIRLEMAVDLGLATLTGVVLLMIFRRAMAVSGSRLPSWAPALLSLLTFSLCQWENWLWGGQMHFFLNALCVCGAVWALGTGRAAGFAGAIALGIVAAFSLGSGLLFWWVGLFMIAMAKDPGAQRRRRIVVWSASGAAVYALYFHDFVPFTPAGERLSPIRSPLIFARYALTFLGSPAVSFSGSAYPPSDSGAAAAVGLASLVLFAILALRLWRGPLPPRRPVISFAAFCGYALLASGAAAAGRGKFGIPQAMASRYTTISLLWWIGLCGLLLVGSSASEQSRRSRRMAGSALAGIAALILVSSLVCIPIFPRRWRLLESARGAVLENGPDALLARLHPNVNRVRSGIAILKATRLSVFRDAPDRLHIRRVAVPLKAFGQILTAEEPVESLHVGKKRTVRMRVMNPSNENWSALGDGTGVYSVRLSYHWLREDGTAAVMDGKRTLLPADLGPNGTVRLKACLEAPATAGRYALVWTLVQEQVAWFDAAGAGALRLNVNVLP